MAFYFFSLSNELMPYHPGEDLPNDAAATAHAERVARDISGNRPPGWQAPRIFNAEGKRVG